jgi:hypothetical protein
MSLPVKKKGAEVSKAHLDFGMDALRVHATHPFVFSPSTVHVSFSLDASHVGEEIVPNGRRCQALFWLWLHPRQTPSLRSSPVHSVSRRGGDAASHVIENCVCNISIPIYS